jgi:Homeodomain-like domain
VHSRETVAEALRLAGQGLNNCEIARRTGVSRPTIREWAGGKLPHSFEQKSMLYGRPSDSARLCARCGAGEHRFNRFSTAYAYLLGMYLGDGHISRGRRDVFRLRIALDKKYPLIVEECAAAMQAVMPWNKVHCQSTPKNYIEVHAYSKSWPCLFPQHGPGKKHERKIELTEWQEELVARTPGLLLRGLIHSDGCRFTNTGSYGWECPRYVFTNFSEDIKKIFCDTCDAMNLHWTVAPPKSVYVSRKDDVAKLDEFVGAKR